MVKKKLFSYIFAGLDFLVDTNGNIVFLEANSSPGFIIEYENVYGKCDPIDQLIEVLKDKKEIIFLYPEEYVFFAADYGYRYGKFKQAFQKRCRQIVLPNKKIKNFKLPLKDRKGNLVEQGTLMTVQLHIKKVLAKNKNFYVPNPYEVGAITVDKWKTQQIVQGIAGMKIPKSFIFSTKKQLVGLVEKNKLEQFFIKPRFGKEGEGIILVKSKKQLSTLEIPNGKWILQEKIDVKKVKNQFWCIRTFVVNGKYVGSLKLTSKNVVVNTPRTTLAQKLEKSLQKKLAPVAEECVAAIEEYIQKKKQS